MNGQKSRFSDPAIWGGCVLIAMATLMMLVIYINDNDEASRATVRIACGPILLMLGLTGFTGARANRLEARIDQLERALRARDGA